jgi:hypothetical protein
MKLLSFPLTRLTLFADLSQGRGKRLPLPRERVGVRGYGRLFLLLAIFLFPALPASSAQISSEYLIHVCSSDKKGKEMVSGGHITCQAYIAGVMDYHALLSSLGTAPSISFCVPSNVELGDLQTVVLHYLLRNPQHKGFIASPAVALALYEAFPCK